MKIILVVDDQKEVRDLVEVTLRADGYFTKPFSPLDLIKKVEEVLSTYSSHSASHEKRKTS